MKKTKEKCGKKVFLFFINNCSYVLQKAKIYTLNGKAKVVRRNIAYTVTHRICVQYTHSKVIQIQQTTTVKNNKRAIQF